MSTLLTPSMAAKHLACGQLIAYPTEAVYGIGCDPKNTSAVKSVLSLKGRDKGKGFIIIASDITQLEPFIEPPNEFETQRLNEVWPGPVTFVVRAKPHLPSILTGGRNTLAVRVSSHPVVKTLCNECGHALISTSANLSGKSALTSADEVWREFGASLAGVVTGSLGNLKSATPIFSLDTGEQLR